MTRDESNRKIAEALGIKHATNCLLLIGGNRCDCGGKPYLDFFLSEEANALVLEAMPRPSVLKRYTSTQVYWECTPEWANGLRSDVLLRRHADRKTAICEAYLAMLEEK